MSNPYGPNQPSQWGGPQVPNGQYPVGAQGAVYGTPSAHQQPSGATGAGYGHAQPTVNQQAQPGYYQAPSPMPQVQPVGAPSYGSVGAMPPRQKSHAGLIIGIVVAILVILLMIRHPRLGRPRLGRRQILRLAPPRGHRLARLQALLPVPGMAPPSLGTRTVTIRSLTTRRQMFSTSANTPSVNLRHRERSRIGRFPAMVRPTRGICSTF